MIQQGSRSTTTPRSLICKKSVSTRFKIQGACSANSYSNRDTRKKPVLGWSIKYRPKTAGAVATSRDVDECLHVRSPLRMSNRDNVVCSLKSLVKSVMLNRSEEHTSELQSPCNLVCRLL